MWNSSLVTRDYVRCEANSIHVCGGLRTVHYVTCATSPVHMNGVCFAQPSHSGICVSAPSLSCVETESAWIGFLMILKQSFVRKFPSLSLDVLSCCVCRGERGGVVWGLWVRNACIAAGHFSPYSGLVPGVNRALKKNCGVKIILR